jgi:spore germination cell wall hydrolase CwlJ-like protein
MFEHDDDRTLLARLIWGEARGESFLAKCAVGLSVWNRTGRYKWWGHTLREVILHPWQYSAFNENDVNLEKLKDPTRHEGPWVWQVCLDTADMVLATYLIDWTLGATHYHDTSIEPPDWATAEGSYETLREGSFIFYAGVK